MLTKYLLLLSPDTEVSGGPAAEAVEGQVTETAAETVDQPVVDAAPEVASETVATEPAPEPAADAAPEAAVERKPRVPKARIKTLRAVVGVTAPDGMHQHPTAILAALKERPLNAENTEHEAVNVGDLVTTLQAQIDTGALKTKQKAKRLVYFWKPHLVEAGLIIVT